MSSRVLAAGLRPATRRASLAVIRQLHHLPTGGLLRADLSIRATRRRMWFSGNSFHNAVITRNASFARFLPKLVVKFARIPAMFGGLAIGTFAWVQYQANRMFLPTFQCLLVAQGTYSDMLQRLALTLSSFSIQPRTP